MPDIRYVCLSDMHLGAQNSLLTTLNADCADSDPRVASPVLVQLVTCLNELISQNESAQKPTLILNGDILELALTTDNIAAMAFERFIELILPANGEALFDKIIYLPGNHDHHLWETARETQYVQYITHNDKQKTPGSLLDIPWHTTKMFSPDRVPAIFMEAIISRYPHLATKTINTVYPNLGLISDDGSRCVVFSHGHFVESMYMLMSKLRRLMFPQGKPANSIYAIEAENFAWIDFFWSTMGRSGAVGTDVELVYDKLQSEPALQRLLDNLAEGIEREYDLPGWDWLDKKILRSLFHWLLKQVKERERCTPEVDLSTEAEQGLRQYLAGPIVDQILQERSGNIPPHFTFVFGHTHKPFQRDLQFDGGLPPWIHVYNSGGWVVDTTSAATTHGGAAVLIDENLNATSLTMYTEQEFPEAYQVVVTASTHANDAANPFNERIASMVDANKDPWKLFAEVVAKEVAMRYKNLQIHIDRA